MHSPSSSTLYLLCSALIIHASLTTAVDPLHAVCSTSKNYTSDGAFSNSLHQMMFLLATKAAPIGFALGSVGHGDARVNGLALCRGDVRSSACAACIRTAGARVVRDLCPGSNEAIVWFDECMLRYSDTEFFGEVDYDHSFSLFDTRNTFNTGNVSDAKVLDGKVEFLLERLKNKTYISPLLFANQESEIGESRNLFGVAQCTKDISGGDCKKCLEAAIDKLRACCSGRRGGRVVGGSCNMRYQSYPATILGDA